MNYKKLKKDIQTYIYYIPLIKDLYFIHKRIKHTKIIMAIIDGDKQILNKLIKSVGNDESSLNDIEKFQQAKKHPLLKKYAKQYMSINTVSNYASIKKVAKLDSPYLRLSDGELGFLCGQKMLFQTKNDVLYNKLWSTIKQNNVTLSIAQAYGFFFKNVVLSGLNNILNSGNQDKLDEFFNLLKGKKIYSAIYTRGSDKIAYQEIKKIWNNKEVCFVTSKMGASYDFVEELFDNIKGYSRIDTPATNAIEEYERILQECTSKPKDTLFLLSIGATAKVLLADLFNLGYKGVDIGQLTPEYIRYMKGGKSPEAIQAEKGSQIKD